MSRRLHQCLTCTGQTRHRAVCGPCRRRGVTVTGGQVAVPLELRVPKVLLEGRTSVHLVNPASPHAPTIAEVLAGVDLDQLLAWHGTDCPCLSCAGDRIPGRYA